VFSQLEFFTVNDTISPTPHINTVLVTSTTDLCKI